MKYLLSVILLGLAMPSWSAGCNATGCTGTPSELFGNFYLTGSAEGRVYLHMKSDVPNRSALDCTLAENAYMTLKKDHPVFKEIYSSLLSASAMDRQIHLRIKNGSSNCEVLYVRFYM